MICVPAGCHVRRPAPSADTSPSFQQQAYWRTRSRFHVFNHRCIWIKLVRSGVDWCKRCMWGCGADTSGSTGKSTKEEQDYLDAFSPLGVGIVLDEFSPDPDLIDYEKLLLVILQNPEIPLNEGDSLKHLYRIYQLSKGKRVNYLGCWGALCWWLSSAYSLEPSSVSYRRWTLTAFDGICWTTATVSAQVLGFYASGHSSSGGSNQFVPCSPS